MERRLSAILAADVVGYSRLMGEDEAGTLGTLKEYRASCVDPRIAEHGGRIVKTTGDGLLAEFPSVVEAVVCAAEIQANMAAQNDAVPADRQFRFRIGINVGDVIADGDDIYGDGVNVAARLEGLAEPGGICLSRAVRDQIRDKLDYVLDDLGEIEVKNIARPVRAFRVALDGASGQRSPPTVAARTALWRRPATVAALLLIVVAAGVLGWIRPWEPGTVPPARTGQIGIAVLPFNNLSGDPGQEYFSDGITEDLISDLSRVSGLFVIARSTMFTYKGKTVGAQQVGRELAVPYVLEGSVRKAGNRVRVNAQLIDAARERPLWAERYDRALTGVFDLQDEVSQKIISALAVTLTRDEAGRLGRVRTSPEAYDMLLRGLAELRRYTPETAREAIRYFERALALDPNYARAYAALGYTYAVGVIFGWTKSPEADGRRALELIGTAEKLAPNLPQVHFAYSNAYRALRRLDEAIAAAHRAVQLDPNYADAYAALAITLNYAGRPEEGIDAIRKSMRLNPRFSFFEVWVLAQGYFVQERYADAIVELRKVIETNPSFVQGHKLLAAAYALKGDTGDASWETDEILNLLPSFTLSVERERAPYIKPVLDRYMDGLRKAGARP